MYNVNDWKIADMVGQTVAALFGVTLQVDPNSDNIESLKLHDLAMYMSAHTIQTLSEHTCTHP